MSTILPVQALSETMIIMVMASRKVIVMPVDQELEDAGVVVLVLPLDLEGVVQAEGAGVDGGQRGHHDRDLAGAGRGEDPLAVAVGGGAGLEVFEVPAGDVRFVLAQRVQLRDHVLHG